MMPYRAPLPTPGEAPFAEEKNPHLLGAFSLPKPWWGNLFSGLFRRKLLSLARGERLWLHALPFPVQGYLEALCRSFVGAPTCQVSFVVTLQHDVVPNWVIEGLPELTRQPLQVTQEGTTLRLSGVSIPVSPEAPTNERLRSWLQECLREIILPLHQSYPVSVVSILVQ